MVEETKKKVNTIKSIGKKVADNGDANDYVYVPIGADSDNVDRPDGSTVEESLSKIETDKVEIIPVEALPTSDIKVYPFIYALVKPNESKGILYEYRDGIWIPYGNDSKSIWVGTKEECAKDFNNIENGTIVIIVKKNDESGDTHTHDYVEYVTKAPTYSVPGIKTCTCFLCGESHTEEIPALIDSINPAGVIRIGDKEYAEWKDTVSFDTYYKDDQTVEIEATNNETGVKEIAYHLATTGISESELETIEWTIYNEAFTITPNNNYIVYVRITDNSDNITYICTDGIVMDNIPPTFEGLEDGGTYPTGTVLTVEEGATLTVDGEVVELVNNSYTFTEVKDNCRLSIIDRAGNETSIYIIVEEKIIDVTLTSELLTDAGVVAEGDIIIPETYTKDGTTYRITKIKNATFYKNKNITSIVIPNTVAEIETNGFNGCTSLTSVVIPDSVKIIKGNAFYDCSSLESVTIPDNTEFYGLDIFKNCSNLKYIKLPKSIYIPVGLLYNCASLTSVVIPDSVIEIGQSAFGKCSKLMSITIPDKVTTIGLGAFYDCEILEISIPNSVTSIGDNAFYNVPHIYYNGKAPGSPWGALAVN